MCCCWLVAQVCLSLFDPHRARQAPLSMGLPRQYWSGLPFPSSGDLPHPGIEHMPPTCQVNSLPLSHLGSLVYVTWILSYLKKRRKRKWREGICCRKLGSWLSTRAGNSLPLPTCSTLLGLFLSHGFQLEIECILLSEKQTLLRRLMD